MGKKAKGNKKGTRGESSDDEQVLSDADENQPEMISDRPASSFDMSESIDMLSEKKFNLREPALKKIITFLQGSHDDEENLRILDGYIETLTTHLTRMLRRPATTQEGLLCLELVCLLALYLTDNSDFLIKNVEKPIMALAKTPDAGELQVQALFTISFAAYVATKEEFAFRIVEDVQDLILNETGEMIDDELLSRAVDCWVLLCSLLPATEVVSKSKDLCVFEALFTHIDEASSTSVNSKVSAGKAIAFIYECAEKLNPDASIEDLSSIVCDDVRVVQQGLECLKKIARDSSKKVSKKSRKEQRAEFRDIVNFLETGEQACEVLRMQGADVTVEGFGQNCVADALREVLGTGFHSSLVAFPAVREILEVEYMSSDNIVSQGKKASKSSNKQRTLDRLRDREFRDIYSADFHDGGDF